MSTEVDSVLQCTLILQTYNALHMKDMRTNMNALRPGVGCSEQAGAAQPTTGMRQRSNIL